MAASPRSRASRTQRIAPIWRTPGGSAPRTRSWKAVQRSRLCGAAAASARALYSHHQAGALRSSFLLSSNARTVALFISMLATSPIYFFCYEGVALSLVLVATLAQQRRRNRALLRALGQT